MRFTYLVDNNEEATINENTPDGNVGEDAGWESVGIDGNGSVPVQGDEGPSEWASNGGTVKELCI
jgi:hypothetical protein